MCRRLFGFIMTLVLIGACVLIVSAESNADQVLLATKVHGTELFCITQDADSYTLRLYEFDGSAWKQTLANNTVIPMNGDEVQMSDISEDGSFMTYTTDGESWNNVMTWKRMDDQCWHLVFYSNPDPFYQVAVTDSELQFFDEIELEGKITSVPVTLDTDLATFDGAAFSAILQEHPSIVYHDENN